MGGNSLYQGRLMRYTRYCSSLSELNAPRIRNFEWGKIEVDYNGMEYRFKDCVLTPNNATEWNWKLDGTEHDPGITIEAIEGNKLLDNVDIVILSKGINQVLKTMNETEQYLDEAKKNKKILDYFILQSEQAVDEYTKRVDKGEKVAALFHSTC